MVDLVEKSIKINGMIDYKRFFFKRPANLINPNLQTVFTQSSPLFAIMEYDNKLSIIETLVIRNNTGEFIVRLSNWLTLRYQGTLEQGHQGEVFAKLNNGEPAELLFHNIINPGNSPVRYLDDPRSSDKVLTQGSVFFYPNNHRGMIPYINELTQGECVLS